MNNDNAADAIDSYYFVGYNQQDIHEFLRVYQGVDLSFVIILLMLISQSDVIALVVFVCICVSVCRISRVLCHAIITLHGYIIYMDTIIQ